VTHVLIIGTGSIGERHLRCFLETGRGTVSFCDVSDEVRQRIRTSYATRSDFAQLDDADLTTIDAAVVCVPAHLHLAFARRLVSHDVAVLIEKPISTSTKEAIEFAEEGAGICGVAYVMRHHPGVRLVRQIIQEERFGSPVQLVFAGGQHFPLYRPDFQRIYCGRRETGGGAMQDALTHMMNVAEWIVGPVTSVTADVDRLVLDGVSVEDTVHVLTRHSSVMGSYSLNQHQAVNEGRLTIHCQKGSVRVDFGRNVVLTACSPGDDWSVEKEFNLERDDMFVSQANAFLDQVEGSAHAVCTPDEATQTLRVMLTALEAAESQVWRSL